MFKANVRIQGKTKISFSKQVFENKEANETHDAFDKRTVLDKLHVDSKGKIVIPGIMIKRSLDGAAKFMGKIPGKGNATYTKHFLSGVQVMSDIDTGINKEDTKIEAISGASDGVRGGSKRVTKNFPYLDDWKGELLLLITDDIVNKETLKQAFGIAGTQIGIGRFRPINGGNAGMFVVTDIEVTPIKDFSEVWG